MLVFLSTLVHVYLNFNCFQIISLITPQEKIDSLQPVAEITGEDRWTVPPKVLMGSSGLTDPPPCRPTTSGAHY